MTAADARAQTVEEFAPAKINLTLHVTGQRPDGYHLLDSLVVFADLGDRITVRRAGHLGLRVTGPMASGVPVDSSNLVLRAAAAIGIAGAEITLDKHLPAAAGIGGGTSDAAAALRALRRSHGASPLSDEQILQLGADMPVCMGAVSARMSGIGEQVTVVPGIPALAAVLINPGVSVQTPDAFHALSDKSGRRMPAIPAFRDAAACCGWLKEQRNDLQAPVARMVPAVAQVLETLRGTGAEIARMSGSGATCFGLYPTRERAETVARTLSRDHPGWWIRATTLASRGTC
ncbi:4-(cytidine 5'-diphospho)-2-C-methyl-D-erythritol kinase [Rhodobacteraceae bacterium F11138]|nr:4-(cytidine 5'-diphospho)-2-C-methyl-D-erythritol kinase [Rhodobacteraceae bacterium F11138]